MWRSLLAFPRTQHPLARSYQRISSAASPGSVASFHLSARLPLLAPPAPAASSPAPSSPASPLSASGVSSGYKVFNVSLDARKPLVLALRGVYGVGRHRARLLCGQLGLNPNTPLSSVTQTAFSAVKQLVEASFQPRHIEERGLAARILHKVKIGCYAGIRHTQCLPVRGQRTQTNARTQRKLGRQRMVAFNIPAFNKKKPGSAGSKPQLATLAQQHSQQQQQQAQQSQSKQGQRKAG